MTMEDYGPYQSSLAYGCESIIEKRIRTMVSVLF